MKIICNRQNLVDAVSNVQRSVSLKSSLAALEGILIEAKDNNLKLCGYNLELGITTHISAKIEEPGSIVLTAKIFSDIVRKLPDDEVLISTDEKLMTNIKSNSTEFTIIGIDPSEYPELPQVSDSDNISISSALIKSMIKQTIFAVADNDAKPIHTGTLFEIKENEIKLVSVDGYRLAMRIEKIHNDKNLNFVVPGKTLSEILKLIDDENDKETKIFIGKRHIIFEVDNYSVISRLLEGEFLDYNAAIPDNFSTKLTVSTKRFTESVDRVSLLITDRLKSPVRCLFSDGEVKTSCYTSIGKANDKFSVKIDGDNVEIGFNNRYLLDALKNSETDEIVINLNGPISPMKITPKDGDEFLFLVLPVRLKSEA